MTKIKVAKGISLKVLNLFNFDAWTSNWNTIYIREKYKDDKKLIAHEMCHIEQIKKDGRLWQPIKYAYYLIRYGYKNNPYEVEARKAEELTSS